MGGNTIVGDHLLLEVSVDAARARLARLAGDGVLLGASECAYGAGITGLVDAAGPW
jgi:tetrahydromethanopterin S-methyltransferase subunit D